MVNQNKPTNKFEKLFAVYWALSEVGEIAGVFGGKQVDTA
jgi:hypothetical protein